MRHPNQNRPLTEFAKSLSQEEFRKHDMGSFWGSWQLWSTYVTLTVAFTYFPWSSVAGWPEMQKFADFMAAMLPVIDKLQPELRQLPYEVSRVKLATIHATGMAFAIWRLVTQPRLATRQMDRFESFGVATMTALGLLYFLYHTFNHVGYAEGGKVYDLHETALGASFIHGAHWIGVAFFACVTKGLYQEFWYEPNDWNRTSY